MLSPIRIAQGLLGRIENDLAGGHSPLAALCAAAGVTCDLSDDAQAPGEKAHLKLGERGSPHEGLTIEIIPEATSTAILMTGTGQRHDYTVTLKAVYRDEVASKLSATPDARAAFLSDVTAAVAALLDPKVLAPAGAWTLPTGEVVGAPQLPYADTSEAEEARKVAVHTTLMTFTCYSLS